MYDREKYKAKDPVWTVYESRPVGNPTALCVEPGSFKWNTKLTGTYTGGLYTYTNKQKKININVKVGTDERQLKLTGKVSSEADAKARLIAAIKNANHGATQISFTMLGYPAGASAQCFNLVGYGKMDGKYFVDQMEHSISPSSGYKTQVKASKVEKEDYLLAMERSPIKDVEIKVLLKAALTDEINSREVYMKGIDHSYYYEGYTTFKAEEL